jgi:hypothetical protein
MKSSTALPLVASLLPIASAHFGLTYPPWRFDTLSDTAEADGYNQWLYPCAGVPATSASSPNRTAWPIGGGSFQLDLHHGWTYVFVNLGLGVNATNFNITLTPEFLNVTGSGQFCLPKLDVPEGAVKEGDLGSLQVVTVGDSGSALYNCADIRFTSNATTLSDSECETDEGIEYYAVQQQTGNEGSSSSSSDSNDDDDSAAAGLVVGRTTMAMVVGGAAAALAFGMGV